MAHALLNKMTVKAGKRDEVAAILLESGAAFNDNPHCLLFLVTKDKNDANVLWIVDVWTDATAHSEAMSTEAMQAYVWRAMPLLEGMPEQIEVELVGGKPDFTKN